MAIAALWINLVGAGLVAWRFLGDYTVARVAGLLAFCLVSFFLEHIAGWGPRPPLLPFTTLVSIWVIWRNRLVVWENWRSEALFAAGFLYCLAWRYFYPDIDLTGERMPNLAMIEAYMRGTRLPAPDIWFPPYRLNFYYSFQHYGASLLGRLLGIGPGVSYQLAYCTLVGFITLLCASCVSRLCSWPVGRWVGTLSLLVGGSGAVVAAHVILHKAHLIDSVRFVGGAVIHEHINPLGMRFAAWMARPGVDPRDLPMEPVSYAMVNGDYHPPLIGFVLLAFAATLIAAQVTGAAGRSRTLNSALLSATVPIALISNAWIFPLLGLLVGGWFVYRALLRDRGYLVPALAGAAIAAFLEYPYLVEFTRQSIGNNASIGLTASADRTPWLGWCLTFWPVVGIMVLSLFNRERRSLTYFLVAVWGVELAVTELFFNHDVYGGVWSRFNTTLKWWPWVYAGIILTLGAANLGSRSAVCRYGTLLLLAPTLMFGVDIAVQFAGSSKDSFGVLEGSGWIKDPVLRDMITELKSRPDGVALESGIKMENTEAPAVSLFGGKMSLLGWPWHETTWRGSFLEIRVRLQENIDFYEGKIADPLNWLLHNNVRYVLWLPRDNGDANARFRPLFDRIKSRYYWHQMYGNGESFAVGYWERVDDPPAPAAAR
ncbi:MAG TPA: DUF2298 domain-containing protein [Opitutaceae bacterium]